MIYADLAPEGERLARLVAEISAKGYNPYVQLGEYRSHATPRLPPSGSRCCRPSPSAAQGAVPLPARRPAGAPRYAAGFSGRVHFTDTTARDVTQSNSGNRFRLAEDGSSGPILTTAASSRWKTAGGAHFHVAMMANMTYPFSEALEWNKFAPKTLKQILIRSTNVLGYTPAAEKSHEVDGRNDLRSLPDRPLLRLPQPH
ncbi:MAG: hypothetical protein V8Q84_09860 [Bilophila sp.]